MGKYHCLTCLHPVALLHTNSIILSCLVEFNPVKLETNCFYSDTFPFKVSECSLFLQTNCQRSLKHLSNQSKRSVQFWFFAANRQQPKQVSYIPFAFDFQMFLHFWRATKKCRKAISIFLFFYCNHISRFRLSFRSK